MLKRTFNPKLKHRVVIYLRMSSDMQNPRSPKQQLREIRRQLKALGYPWVIVKIYRDTALTGRLLRKRLEYQNMLRDLKTGLVSADLILVDDIERFARVDELPTIRKQLYEQHGVLVLASDSNFCDPNTPQGRALGMVETMRATEHGRILGRNVLRGKRDAALQKHWPGGPTPFGYKLQNVMKLVSGCEEVDYRILVPDPRTSWIIKLLFKQAADTSWGTTKLARFLNDNPEIPTELKPFKPASIGYWLDQPLYFGELVWERNSTGIIDDMRVVERNTEEDVLRVPNFCEPIVDHELWMKVHTLRQIRKDRHAKARKSKSHDNGKLITAPAPGMTLTYLLSGLVYCQECGLRMTASSSAAYTTKSGEQRRYVSYICPGNTAGHCNNDIHVQEKWLREIVVQTLRDRLFPWG